jgi:hypothetical protein
MVYVARRELVLCLLFNLMMEATYSSESLFIFNGLQGVASHVMKKGKLTP